MSPSLAKVSARSGSSFWDFFRIATALGKNPEAA
jgi:hypothetical protein